MARNHPKNPWWALLGALVGLACGDEPPAAGGPGSDAGTPDAAQEASADEDAGRPVAGGPLTGIDCVLRPEDQTVEPISPVSGRAFALSVTGNQVELVWTLSGCGNPARSMRRLSFSSSEPVPSSQPWLGMDACAWRQDPALLHYADPRRAGERVIEAFYAERTDGGFVPTLHEVVPGDGPVPLAGPREGAWSARGLSATVLNGRAVLAWVGTMPQEAPDQGRAVHAQLVHFQDTPHTLLARDVGQRPERVALAAMGSTDEEQAGAALAWASHAEGEAGGIFLATLQPDGSPGDGPERLLSAGGDASRVALSGHPSGGGALAYVVDFDDAGAHVRLQLLDAQGRVDGRARQITAPSLRALDVSIAPFGPGYVLAYRRLSPQAQIEPVLQLAFTDSNGVLAGTLDLARAAASGGPTSIATANDGRLVVAWVDTDAGASRLKLWRGSCQ